METAGRHYSILYLDEEDIDPTSAYDYKVIMKEDKDVSSGKEVLFLMTSEYFRKDKELSSNVNLTNVYHKTQPYSTLWLCLTSSNPFTMRNESLDYLIILL